MKKIFKKLTLACLLPIAAMAATFAQNVEINSTNFPDNNFRAWALAQPWGIGAQLTPDDIAVIAIIDVSGKGISSLKGIEYFANLKTLDCSNNQLTSLDVVSLLHLQSLDCYNNQLTSLDLSGLTYFKYLQCHNQNPTITLTIDGSVYSRTIALNNPAKLATGVTYSSGKLISNSNTIASTPFETSVVGSKIKLEGTITLLYSTVACTHIFNALGTLVNQATCTTPAQHKAKCSLCGEEHATQLLNGIPALGHSFTIWIVNPANANEEIEVCSRCNFPSGNTRAITTVCTHIFNALGTQVSAATCTAFAKHKAKCSLCGVEHATQLLDGASPLGHNFSVWIVNPTNANEEIEICSRCNAPSGNTRAITTICTHNFTVLGTQVNAATCTAHAQHKAKCSLCGVEHATQLLNGASPLGHNFSVWIVNPTNANQEIEICSRCSVPSGNTRAITIICTHNFNVLGTQVSVATCTTPAKHKAKCSLCGVEHATLLLDGVAALGHNFNAFGTQVSAATCTNPATYKAKCSLCGVEHATLLLNGTTTLGHNFNAFGTQVSAATCTTPAKYKAKCSLCGEEHATLLLNDVTALGHNFSVWILNPANTNKEIEVCSICGDPSGKTRAITPGSIAINATNFPDNNFRAWALAQPWGSDGYISAEEIAEIKHINVTYQGIQDLTGINYFTNLTSLYCSNNQLTLLNVSSLENLKILYCQDNKLTSLNVSALTNLQELNCSRNRLTALDVSNSINLYTLYCTGQTPTLALTAAGNVYSAAIALNNPTKLAAGITYTGNALTSTNDAFETSGFSVAVTGYAARLEGTFSFTYIGNLITGGIENNTTTFNVYPNPTTDKVFLTTAANVRLFNQQGALLYSGFGNEIDLSNYSNGVYFLQINGDKVVKVVKQ
ncbi:MAG: leucine-rich repeat domain-containing protein [Bacteroidetes bacterium]|nr:leucine-rich repeat domain-containing protein [Bacteroidota bacterium]